MIVVVVLVVVVELELLEPPPPPQAINILVNKRIRYLDNFKIYILSVKKQEVHMQYKSFTLVTNYPN